MTHTTEENAPATAPEALPITRDRQSVLGPKNSARTASFDAQWGDWLVPQRYRAWKPAKAGTLGRCSRLATFLWRSAVV
jgi:hypothetical protein